MSTSSSSQKYPLAMRVVHWTRAAIILALLAAGILMTTVADDFPGKFSVLYPNHKQFGILVLALVLVQLVLRWRGGVPEPVVLKPWEEKIFAITHKLFYVLMIAVPVAGYCLSSTYPESDGVPFFVTSLPELLAKDEAASGVFAAAHAILAYGLLALVALHVAGVVKHRLFDRSSAGRILDRML
jgi:cytochrome b561